MSVTRFTLVAALALLVQLNAPVPAAAQASREGASFTALGPWGTVRLPDVAFDPANGVYLAVSGNLTKGRFVTQDGVPLGAQFDVPTVASHNQAARAVYSPELGGFLVVWYDTRVNPAAYQVWGRLVRVGPNGRPSAGLRSGSSQNISQYRPWWIRRTVSTGISRCASASPSPSTSGLTSDSVPYAMSTTAPGSFREATAAR